MLHCEEQGTNVHWLARLFEELAAEGDSGWFTGFHVAAREVVVAMRKVLAEENLATLDKEATGDDFDMIWLRHGCHGSVRGQGGLSCPRMCRIGGDLGGVCPGCWPRPLR